MEIKTLYTPGQAVIILEETTLLEVCIHSIEITVCKKGDIKIIYWFEVDVYGFMYRDESEVFKSKQEYIDNL